MTGGRETEVRLLCGCRPGLREQCIEGSPVEQPPAQDDRSNATHISDVSEWTCIEQHEVRPFPYSYAAKRLFHAEIAGRVQCGRIGPAATIRGPRTRPDAVASRMGRITSRLEPMSRMPVTPFATYS